MENFVKKRFISGVLVFCAGIFVMVALSVVVFFFDSGATRIVIWCLAGVAVAGLVYGIFYTYGRYRKECGIISETVVAEVIGDEAIKVNANRYAAAVRLRFTDKTGTEREARTEYLYDDKQLKRFREAKYVVIGANADFDDIGVNTGVLIVRLATDTDCQGTDEKQGDENR